MKRHLFIGNCKAQKQNIYVLTIETVFTRAKTRLLNYNYETLPRRMTKLKHKYTLLPTHDLFLS